MILVFGIKDNSELLIITAIKMLWCRSRIEKKGGDGILLRKLLAIEDVHLHPTIILYIPFFKIIKPVNNITCIAHFSIPTDSNFPGELTNGIIPGESALPALP